jgi:hypothetical protein
MPIHLKRYEKFKRTHTERGRPVEIHQFLTRAKLLATWTAYNKVCPPYHKEIGFFTRGFIKLSSQFIFSREQSMFVTSYFASQTYLTDEFLHHLFAIVIFNPSNMFKDLKIIFQFQGGFT